MISRFQLMIIQIHLQFLYLLLNKLKINKQLKYEILNFIVILLNWFLYALKMNLTKHSISLYK